MQKFTNLRCITLGHSIVSVWEASRADLMVSRDNEKTRATLNAGNTTLRCGFWEAVLFCFNYLNFILKHIFLEITLIIIQTNKLTATVFWNEM